MSSKKDAPPADLQNLLGSDHPPRWWQRSSLWIGIAALVVVAAGFAYWQSQQQAKAAPVYVTSPFFSGSVT